MQFSVHTARCAFIHRWFEWILMLYVAEDFNGRFRTGLVPLDITLRPQVMALCDIFFNLSPYITNSSFPRSMPRIAAVDDCDKFSKALKTSQMLLFWTPVLSTNYDV
jgi:hypothetical protein